MKKIGFVIPYFGKLPQKGFELWLLSCDKNPTIDWLLYTDDKTQYKYPSNVIVRYCTLQDIKERAQKCFDFEITLEKNRKLCDFKAAYGEIFADDLKEYDFWGYCDVDLVWGNMRKFLTDDILNKYERIGYQGHCLLYKNDKIVNTRYRSIIDGVTNYRTVFTDPGEFCFDENGMDDIYNELAIPYYQETNFAHLNKYDYGFFLGHLPKSEDYKNKHQVFTWNEGTLLRKYVNQGKIETEEFMYIHFFCRPIQFKFKNCRDTDGFIIYADAVENYTGEIDSGYIVKHSKNSAFHYYTSSIWYNRKKLTPKRIWSNVKRMVQHKILR